MSCPKTLTAAEAQVETSRVKPYHFLFKARHIALVDTPGFDDTNQPDAVVFRELAAWLVARYKEATRMTAILYMQPITSTRMSGSVLRNFQVMKRMLGIQNFPHLILVTSMWDLVDSDLGQKREKEMRDLFWADLIDAGATVARFSGNKDTAHAVLEMIKKKPIAALTIQRELVDSGVALDQTTAGAYIDSEILELLSQTNKTTFDLSDVRQAIKQIGARRELKSDPEYSTLWLNDPQAEARSKLDVYQPLKLDEFRLVELKAGKPSTQLEISIVVRSLSHPPKYSALSYAVGKHQTLVDIGLRQDSKVHDYQIAKNLYAALCSLRRQSDDILIWVDALSINQHDREERAKQVRKMSEIFAQAENVCVWLGVADPDSKNDKAMAFARQIADLDFLETAERDIERQADFLGLAELLASPWFRRRWCVQEILLAKNATVHCGHHVMKWAEFAEIAELLSLSWKVIKETMDLPATHAAGDKHLIDAMALIETSQNMIRKARNGEVLERLLSLEVLLSRLATFEVTVAHDAIYSIYDLCQDLQGTDKIRIDYSIEPRQLFRDVTEFVVRSSGSLDIICRPWAPVVGVPSWVPTVSKVPYQRRDGEAEYDHQQGAVLVNMPGAQRYLACGSRSARGNVSFSKGEAQVLSARGVRIGIVKEVASECPNGVIPSSWMRLAGWRDIRTQPAPEAFWRTIVADQGHGNARAPDWYKRACETSFREARTPHIDTIRLCQMAKSSKVKEFLEKVGEIIWSRRLVGILMDRGPGILGALGLSGPAPQTICLCDSTTIVGDELCILYGCSVPVILRKSGAYYTVIGEAYLHGVMDGEAIKSTATFGGDDSQIFNII